MATPEPETDPILSALAALLPPRRPLPLHEPEFSAQAWQLVKQCLDSGWVSSAGGYVDRFEQMLSDYTRIPHSVATVNGTAALHVCLRLAGVAPGDEVLLPALTFVGTANPVRYLGAIPHFLDCDATTLGLDPHRIDAYLRALTTIRHGVCVNRRSARPIRALLAVHVLGHPAPMDALAELAQRYRLSLVEDAAEALGSWRGDRHTGSWGRLAALSFNGNKILTTGGGGAILTASTELARQARHLTTTAKRPHPWAFEHDHVGYNYRLPNLNAALGCAQLEQLPDLLARKRRLAAAYRRAFAGIPGVRLQREPSGARSNHWLNLIRVADATGRDALLRAAHAQGLLLRPLWTPLHRQPMFREHPRMDLPVSEALFASGVCLPSSANLAPAAE